MKLDGLLRRLNIAAPFLHLTLLTFVFFVFLPYVLEPYILGPTGKGLWRIGRGEPLYNSDLVTPFLVVGDLMRHPSALFTWYYTPAPYVFPDWLLSALVLATPFPGSWMPLIYGALIMALYSLAGGALLATTDKVTLASGAWMTASALALGGILATAFNAPIISTWLYATLAAAGSHTGAALSTLAAAALFLSLLRDSRPPAVVAIVALGVLTFAASFSDILFSVWFVGPACITGLLYTWATHQRRGLLLITIVAIAAATGWVVDQTLSTMYGDSARVDYVAAKTSTGSWALSEHVLRQSLASSLDPLDVPLFLIALTIMALLSRGIVLTAKSLRRLTPTCGEVMEIFLAGVCAIALLAPIMTNMIYDAAHWRYSLILMLTPMLWVVYHTVKTIPAGLRRGFLPIMPLLIVLLCAAILMPAWRAATRLAAPRPIQICIGAEGRTAGLGDYWTAKQLILMSDRRIHMAQIAADGRPYRWITNETWFSRRADNDARPRFDFIVPARLKIDALERVFGPPDQIKDCGDKKLWLYNHPLSLAD